MVYEALDRERHARVALKTLLRVDADAIYRIKNEFHKALYNETRDKPITREEIAQCWDDLRPRFYPERYLADQFRPKVEREGPAAN